MERGPLLAAAIVAQVAVVGCGYPSFQFSAGGAGGAGSSSSSTGSGSSTASSSSHGSTAASSTGTTAVSSTSAGTTASSSSGAPPCTIDHLLISQIRSRGPMGAYDEFIELYNPTDASILLDSGWTITGRSDTSLTYGTRWTGVDKTIPAHSHYLIVGSAYVGAAPADDMLGNSITDAASLVLSLNDAAVSVVCYYYDPASLWSLQNVDYTCAGMPVYNPHDDTTGTNSDQSLERKPGGAAGNCTDTGDSAADFDIDTPSDPRDLASPKTPI